MKVKSGSTELAARDSLELGHALCSNKEVLCLDFCRCPNIKLSPIGWNFSRLNPQPIADSFTFRHLQKSRHSTFLLEQRARQSSSGLEIFYHRRLHEVARGPWLTGYTSFIHTRYFYHLKPHLDTLIWIFKSYSIPAVVLLILESPVCWKSNQVLKICNIYHHHQTWIWGDVVVDQMISDFLLFMTSLSYKQFAWWKLGPFQKLYYVYTFCFNVGASSWRCCSLQHQMEPSSHAS